MRHNPRVTIWPNHSELADGTPEAVIAFLVHETAHDVHCPRTTCGTLALAVVLSPKLWAWAMKHAPAMLRSGFVETVVCERCNMGKVALPVYVGSAGPRDLRMSVVTAADKERLVRAGKLIHTLNAGDYVGP